MKKILTLLSLFMLFSCQGQEKNRKTNPKNTQQMQTPIEEKIDIKKIEKHINLQQNVMTCGDVYDSYTPPYDPTKEDLDLALPLLEKSLFNSGYKFPDYSVFKKKIQEGFGIDIDKSKENVIILYNEEYQYPFYGDLNEDLYDYCASNLFIDKQRRIITPMVLLEDLIKINNKKTEDYSIKQNLKVLSLNKLLVYGDKASLTYLLAKDSNFVLNLLYSFGYEKEERINQAELEDFYNISARGEKYTIGELVFVKNKKGEMKIRENVLKTIANSTSENDNKWLYALNQFGYHIYSQAYKNEKYEYKNQFTLAERKKIVAYILNTYAPLYHKYIVKHEGKAIWDPATLLENLCVQDEKLKDYIISQKYYGLPNLKEELDDTPCPRILPDPD